MTKAIAALKTVEERRRAHRALALLQEAVSPTSLRDDDPMIFRFVAGKLPPAWTLARMAEEVRVTEEMRRSISDYDDRIAGVLRRLTAENPRAPACDLRRIAGLRVIAGETKRLIEDGVY